MLLTVALPVFNDAKAMERTIVSLLNQKVLWGVDAEIVVSDNFSQDAAYDIARNLLAFTSGAKVFRQSLNLGFLGNLKFLNQAASGEYIWFIGAGDTVVDGAFSSILEILESRRYDWGTVRALFEYQDNSGYVPPTELLESCDSSSPSQSAVFNHAVSMNILRRSLFEEFDSCFVHGSTVSQVDQGERGLSALSVLSLWESERCYWPHLEAVALYCSNHSEEKKQWFEYHQVSVLLGENKNGSWDKGLSAMKIYRQWVQVVLHCQKALPASLWLQRLSRELRGLHFLRFSFMVKKDGNFKTIELARQIWAVESPIPVRLLAQLISLTPSKSLKVLAAIRKSVLQISLRKTT